MTNPASNWAEPSRLWAGSGEAIFSALPQTILTNFYSPRSENALLWNLIYPRAQPSLSLQTLLDLEPLWGTADLGIERDEPLIPYYWGYHLDGSRLDALDQVLTGINAKGPRTEVDLFFLGERTLISIESKHTSGFGRCSRYAARCCPEIHNAHLEEPVNCQYWQPGPARFSELLQVGPRPTPESDAVPCNVHYQLARTYLVGSTLAWRLGRQFALWIFLPRKRWRALEPTWLDFVERVDDDQAWRWMRAIAWEQIAMLPTR